jgi:hypothetical protein
MRVSSTNVLDEGLRIRGRGREMNSKVRIRINKAIKDNLNNVIIFSKVFAASVLGPMSHVEVSHGFRDKSIIY